MRTTLFFILIALLLVGAVCADTSVSMTISGTVDGPVITPTETTTTVPTNSGGNGGTHYYYSSYTEPVATTAVPTPGEVQAQQPEGKVYTNQTALTTPTTIPAVIETTANYTYSEVTQYDWSFMWFFLLLAVIVSILIVLFVWCRNRERD